MKKFFPFLALATFCVTPFASYAAIAIPSCEQQDLSPDERAALAEVIFEGKVTMATCKCMPLAVGGDYDGPEVECTDIIQALKPIKGTADPQYTIQTMAMLDPHPDKQLSHSECKSLVSDRNDKLTGDNRTFYLRHNAEGFIESVPKSTCR